MSEFRNHRVIPDNNFFIKYIPINLSLMALFLGILDYTFDEYIPSYLQWLAWFILFCPLMFAGFKAGQFILNLYEKVYKDALTDLGNRGYFYNKLESEMSKVTENDGVLSIAMIDIDNFKKINDTYGHLEGDKIIQYIAKVIKENIRSTDAVVRWGGEEFTIILPKTNVMGAYALSNRIRYIIEKSKFNCDNCLYNVTLSIGVASVDHKIDKDEFVKLADNALYEAKKTKNSVIVCDKYPSIAS